MQKGEASFNPELIEDKPEPPEKVKRIKIRFSVFFDGTNNNRNNTDLRIDIEKGDMLSKVDKEKLNIYEKNKDDDSYKADKTNIAIMEPYVFTSDNVDSIDNGYHLTLTTYVNGTGTLDYEADSAFGYGLGWWDSGLRAKVKKGLDDVVNGVFNNHLNKSDVIECLTLDVFGFSRGSTSARNFIHEALFGDKSEPLKVQLEALGFIVEKVEIDFAGLYDTVSSHGVTYNNDVSVLKLDSIVHAKKVIHLVASEEHRKNFSLISIKSALDAGIGEEYYLPGVHSDVGGSYNLGEDSSENYVVFDGYKEDAIKDLKRLIEAGWYKENEIEMITFEDIEEDEFFAEALLEVKRENIDNKYCRIPLNIMADFVRDSKIQLTGYFGENNNIPSYLLNIYNKLKGYVNNSSGKDSMASHWQHNEKWLRDLRHDDFHFSAKVQFGLTPRFKNGRRYRKIYEG